MSKASQDEAIKQKEALGSEVSCLRGDLLQVREDRDRHLSQVQGLQSEVSNFKECAEKYTADLETLSTKKVELEVCFSIDGLGRRLDMFCLMDIFICCSQHAWFKVSK